jgi:hypothetical protein
MLQNRTHLGQTMPHQISFVNYRVCTKKLHRIKVIFFFFNFEIILFFCFSLFYRLLWNLKFQCKYINVSVNTCICSLICAFTVVEQIQNHHHHEDLIIILPVNCFNLPKMQKQVFELLNDSLPYRHNMTFGFVQYLFHDQCEGLG